LTREPYILHIFNLFFLWAIVASNWNLLMGYAGIWSMGNIAFMVLGAYASAILTLKVGWPVWVGIPAGGVLSMVMVTIFIGLPCLRLQGIYVALMSLMFASTLPTLATRTRSVSGGAVGLQHIPPLFEGITKTHSYYINFALFVVILAIVYRIIRSSSGLAFVALRDSRELAVALGVSEYREKLKVFALTSFLTGIAGGFYAHYTCSVTPSLLGVGPFIMAMAMMLIGGMGRFPGAVLGAAIIVLGGEWLRLFGTLRFAFLGGLICFIVLFLPGGLMQLIDVFSAKMAAFRKNRFLPDVSAD